MKRLLRSLFVGGLIFGAAGATSGCADNNSTLFIAAVMYAKAPTCLVTADITGEQLGAGALDTAFKTNYSAFLLVGNQFSPRGSKLNLKTETTRVILKGAEVHLTDSEGNEFKDVNGKNIGTFSVYGSGYAPPSTGTDPGYGLFEANLIPDSVGQVLRTAGKNYYDGHGQTPLVTQVIADVRVFGNSTGNTDVESSSLSFPISVCYGCLIHYSFDDIQVTGQPPNQKEICAPTAGQSSTETPGCIVGQDDGIPCGFCATTLPICHDVPTGAQ